MTNQLRLKLGKLFVEKLEQVESYRRAQDIRIAYRFLFSQIIQEWAGVNVDTLHEDIDLAQVMSKNQDLEWFFRSVRPQLRKLIEREKDVNDYEDMVMTKLLFQFIKKVGKWQQKDKFDFDDWLSYLDILKSLAGERGIRDEQFQALKDAAGDSKVQSKAIAEIVQDMRKISIAIQNKKYDLDEEGKEFLIDNLLRQFKQDVLAMFCLLAPKVYHHRMSRTVVDFATEAFTNGGTPNIELYKDL